MEEKDRRVEVELQRLRWNCPAWWLYSSGRVVVVRRHSVGRRTQLSWEPGSHVIKRTGSSRRRLASRFLRSMSGAMCLW